MDKHQVSYLTVTLLLWTQCGDTIVYVGICMTSFQKRIPQYTLGVSMVESGTALGQSSLFG